MQGNTSVHPLSTFTQDTIEGAVGDALSLEQEARAFGNPRLLHIAEKITDLDSRLTRGESVPLDELSELVQFVKAQTQPAALEVS